LESNIVSGLIEWRKNFQPENLKQQLEKEKINLTTIEDDLYPTALKNIYDPPPLLFYRGLMKKEEKLLAVVGSRKCTPYGEKIVKQLIPPLIKYKIGISSGLALGIDALAHSAALQDKGRTVAVLGSGIDYQSIYPIQNRRLAEDIISSGGCLISEFPPGTEPLKQNFPRRNRIIAGLSVAVFIAEAAEKSGSLITARYGLEEGREVLAAPGSIFSWQSQGPNKLIKEGARPILSTNDLLEALGLSGNEEETKAAPDWSGMTENERIILLNLSSEASNIDDIGVNTQLDIRIINSTLTILEIKGLVKNSGGGNYILL
jgi:DNA processing protein